MIVALTHFFAFSFTYAYDFSDYDVSSLTRDPFESVIVDSPHSLPLATIPTPFS